MGAGGNDSINGGGHNDTIDGGAGDNILTGGHGVDRFVIGAPEASQDIITDFAYLQDLLVIDVDDTDTITDLSVLYSTFGITSTNDSDATGDGSVDIVMIFSQGTTDTSDDYVLILNDSPTIFTNDQPEVTFDFFEII